MNKLLSQKDHDALLDILVEQIGVQKSQLTPTARIEEDLNADSLTRMETVLAIEDHFKITIPDDRFEGVNTVGDFQEMLTELLAEPR